MTQPLPSETIEYERYVDGLRAENAVLKEILKVAIRQCKRHNEEYHHLTSPEQLVEWEALLDNNSSSKVINIHTEDGIAQLLETLTLARDWINDEGERRGKEDAEYESPASAMVTAIDVVLAKVKGGAS